MERTAETPARNLELDRHQKEAKEPAGLGDDDVYLLGCCCPGSLLVEPVPEFRVPRDLLRHGICPRLREEALVQPASLPCRRSSRWRSPSAHNLWEETNSARGRASVQDQMVAAADVAVPAALSTEPPRRGQAPRSVRPARQIAIDRRQLLAGAVELASSPDAYVCGSFPDGGRAHEVDGLGAAAQ